MTPVDYLILAVVAVSVLISLFRGATREILSIASWIAAFLIALHFAPTLTTLLPFSGGHAWLRFFAAFVLLMVASLIVFALVTMAISRLVKSAGLAPLDRALGALFGLARALVILVALVLAAGLTPLPRDAVWREAVFRPPLENLAKTARAFLPARLAQRIQFDSDTTERRPKHQQPASIAVRSG